MTKEPVCCRSFPRGAWQRTAVHAETVLAMLRQFALHANNHVVHHLVFAAEKRRAMGV